MQAVRAAFSQSKSLAAPSAPARPTVTKGGLDALFHVQLGEPLESAAASPCGKTLAISATGSVVLLDSHGTIIRRSDAVGEDPPNVIAWSSDSRWVGCCSDDGYARIVAVESGALAIEHLIAEEPAPGKRTRCVPSEHCLFVGGTSSASGATSFVGAAGPLIHACEVPGGKLVYSVSTDAPVRAMCRSPPSLVALWAVAAAYKGGVLLVSASGDSISKLSSRGHPRSLATSHQWLASATFDGTVELWDVAKRAASSERPSEADKTYKTFCGSDGARVEHRVPSECHLIAI